MGWFMQVTLKASLFWKLPRRDIQVGGLVSSMQIKPGPQKGALQNRLNPQRKNKTH